ncbi:hypothetical protein BKA93DRAFT_698013, partial [Sparassis latifolia]
ISSSVSSLIGDIYPDIGSVPPPAPDYFLHRTILAARNANVDGINAEVLSRMSSQERVYMSVDTVI